VLSKTVEPKEAILSTEYQGLDIIPSAGLGGTLKVFAETTAATKPYCIQALTKALAEMGYKYCVIDEGPGWGNLERAAALASNEIVSPIMPDFFGLDGLGLFFSNLATLREDMNLDKEKPAYNKILVNALDGRIGQHLEVMAKILEREKRYKIYVIPVDPIFRKAQSAGCTVQSLSGAKPETVAEFNRIANDIVEGE
jgi:chromosome partitioning protein